MSTPQVIWYPGPHALGNDAAEAMIEAHEEPSRKSMALAGCTPTACPNCLTPATFSDPAYTPRTDAGDEAAAGRALGVGENTANPPPSSRAETTRVTSPRYLGRGGPPARPSVAAC